MTPPPFSLAAWPIQLQDLHAGSATLLFLGLAIPIVFLGMRNLAGLGPARKWVAIGVRLAVLLVFVLIIGGIQWQRTHRNLEVLVLSDVSKSTDLFHEYPGGAEDLPPNQRIPLQAGVLKYLEAASTGAHKPADDRIGIIKFGDSAQIDVIPSTSLVPNARPIEEEGMRDATNIAGAVELGMATFRQDAMRRLVLISDGLNNEGDAERSIASAASQHVPIDVVKLHYEIQHEVMMDRFVAPSWKRQNEPFTVEVFLKSTNPGNVTGELYVEMLDSNGRPTRIHFDPKHPEQDYKVVTLKPGTNVERVMIPGLPDQSGVIRFKATFQAPNVTAQVGSPGSAAPGAAGGKQVDTLNENNTNSTFTFVRGKGQILYVDNVKGGDGRKQGGELLQNALAAEGITLVNIGIDQFPTDLVTLQNYDAVILANVPHGLGGLGDIQDRLLSSYVHDMGGGLVMIGGPDTFGAGGWQGSKLEEVLPINMDIPAQRQMPKGALVLVMHSCEMPQGNYWGEQCALQAVKALSSQDDIGVISYGWGNANGQGVGGAQWDFPLQTKLDGARVTHAIKNMQLGDMPSFDDSLTLAINGAGPNLPCLMNSNARAKHIIVISDGDPAAPAAALIAQCKANKITISTVTVFTHNPGIPSPTMVDMAQQTGGRSYGPIESSPSQLPQIFIKEATIVRRSLIHENSDGIAIDRTEDPSDLVKGIAQFPDIYGLVLTSRKDRTAQNDVKVPLVVGKNHDPLLASWQAGLGKVVCWTSDAHNKWAPNLVASKDYSKFWSQVVRSVSRPPMSTDFEINMTQDGKKGTITVRAANADVGYMNFMTISGRVAGPSDTQDVRLVQTGPGTYSGQFDLSNQPGNYVSMLTYRTKDGGGSLIGGMAVNDNPEFRDLTSNDQLMQHIADATGGRVLDPFDPETANLFSRVGLPVTSSPMPVWDIVLPILLGLILLDVMVRRIAWDWLSIKRMAAAAQARVLAFTQTTRKVESGTTLESLKRVRDEVAEQKFRPGDAGRQMAPPPMPGPTARPDPKAKFEAKGVEGDISNVVGGATDKPIPTAPKNVQPKGVMPGEGGHTGGLLEAKRRAQRQIREKEQGE